MPVRVARIAAAALVASLLLIGGAAATASAHMHITQPGDNPAFYNETQPTFKGDREKSFGFFTDVVTQALSAYPASGSGPLTLVDSNFTRYTLTDSGYEWAFQPRTPLPDGRYYLRARQVATEFVVTHLDEDTRDVYIDTEVPDTVIDSATPPSPTNATARTFTFHADETNPSPGGVTYECAIDGGAPTACTSPYTTPTLTDGAHSFAVRAADRAGNVDPTPATASWLLDATPPVITLNRPAPREHFLLHSSVTPDYGCVDPPTGTPLASSGLASCTDDGFDTHPLGPGTFTVHATDYAGNSADVQHAYVIDPPRYGDFVLRDHPIAFYRLGDPLGSAAMADSSGHSRNGEYKNGIALRRPAAIACERRPHPPRACETDNDPQDFAAFFPPRDGYGFTNNITAPRSAYALEAWINPEDSDDMSIVGQGGGGQLFIHGGHLALRQTQDTVEGGGPTLTPGQWWHVAATWDGHTTRLFVNGDEVESSTTANKPPSGTSTLYVGYGDQAPWFHGTLDEVAYYDSAVSAHMLGDHYAIGTAYDHPSLGTGPLATAGPGADPETPANNGWYAPTKVPNADFRCTDPDGPADIASCTATVDGIPVADGGLLRATPGSHTFVITAVDQAGLTYVHTHTYTVAGFEDIYLVDAPVAYFRLGDPVGSEMADLSGNGRNGEYKNDQDSGPVGIAGDGDHARQFFGAGGYGYVNGISAPRFQSTLEAWVNPDDGRSQSIVGHGDAGELFIRNGLFAFRHMDQTVTAHIGPTPGHFSQVVGVWDGVTIQIYVDGELHGSVEATKRPSSVSTFYVGYGELAPWFKGSLDEVAYYPTALTSGRVLQHFLADPPPDGSGGAPTTTTGTTLSPPPTATQPAGTPLSRTTTTPAKPKTSHTTPKPKPTAAARCRVPKLHGLKVTSAKKALAKAHCKLGSVSHRKATRSQRGRVLRQSVSAGTRSNAGRAVRVTVGR